MSSLQTTSCSSTAVPVAVIVETLPGHRPAKPLAITAPMRPVAVAVAVAVPEAIPVDINAGEPKPVKVLALTARVRPVAAIVAEPVVAVVAESLPEAVPADVIPVEGSRHRIFSPLPDRRDLTPPDSRETKPASHAWRSLS